MTGKKIVLTIEEYDIEDTEKEFPTNRMGCEKVLLDNIQSKTLPFDYRVKQTEILMCEEMIHNIAEEVK